jgi:O-antigen/teichoic acid export membrane protein
VISRVLPLMAASLAFAICGYVIQVFLARQLGPADYGLIGLAMSVASLANVVQASGVPQSVSTNVARRQRYADAVLSTGLKVQAGISLALLALLASLAPVLGVAFHEPELVAYLLLVALMLPGFGMMTAYSGYWNGRHRFSRQAGLIAAYAVSKVLLIVGLAWVYGPVGALVGYALAPIGGIVVGFRRVGLRSHVRPRILLQQAAPMVAVSLTSLAIYSVDLYLVTIFLSDDAATGHYVAAQSVAVVPLLATAAFAQVLLPRIATETRGDDRLTAGHSVSQGLRQVLLMLVPGVAVLSATAPGVVRILFGSAFDAAGPALRVLVVSHGAVAVLLVLASVLNGAGRARDAARCTLVALVVTVIAGAALTPVWSLVGAATSVGVGAVLGCGLALRRIRQTMSVSLGRKRVVRSGVSGALAFGVGSLPAPLAVIPVQWLAALAVALGFVWVSGEFTAEERGRMRALLRRNHPAEPGRN